MWMYAYGQLNCQQNYANVSKNVGTNAKHKKKKNLKNLSVLLW